MLKRFFSSSIRFPDSAHQISQFYTHVLSDPSNKLFKDLYVEELAFEDKIYLNRTLSLKSGDMIHKGEPILRISSKSCIDETVFYNNVIKTRSKHIQKIDEISKKLVESQMINESSKTRLNTLLKMAFEIYNDLLAGEDHSISQALIESQGIVDITSYTDEHLQNIFSVRDIEKIIGIKTTLDIITRQVAEKFPNIESDRFSRCLLSARYHSLPLCNVAGEYDVSQPEMLFPIKQLVGRAFEPNCFLHTFFDYPTDTDYLILKARQDIQPNQTLSITCAPKRKVNSQYSSVDRGCPCNREQSV